MLSLVCCNYNDSRFAIDWAEKVAMAGYDEVILVDDFSTDISVKLFENLGVRVIKSESKGVFSAALTGIKEAKGEFIICGAMDDYPLNGHGRIVRDAITKFPFVDIITYASYVEREGEPYLRSLFPFDAYISPEYLSKLYRNGFSVEMTAPAVRKEILLKSYETKLKANLDSLHNLYAMFDKGFIHLAKPLYVYRSYPNSFGSAGKIKDIKEANKTTIRFMKENLSHKSYTYFLESGVCSEKMLWKIQLGLFLVPRLPKAVRRSFYKKFYGYDWRAEKL